MTFSQAISRIDPLKLIAWAFVLGITYATFAAKLDAKADKLTVDQMARDIRVVRILLCEQAAKDSFCRGVP